MNFIDGIYLCMGIIYIGYGISIDSIELTAIGAFGMYFIYKMDNIK